MSKHLIYSVPLLLAACSDTSEKYRDLHQLELPPTLAIEHTNSQPVVEADDMKPKSALAGLMAFADDGEKPRLTLKTRGDRAWEMIETALKLTDIQVLDKNRDDNHLQVRYDPDIDGKDVGLLASIFNNQYEEAEYNISLTQEAAAILVQVRPSKPDEVDAGDNGAAELLRLLHKTIDEKIINRKAETPKE